MVDVENPQEAQAEFLSNYPEIQKVIKLLYGFLRHHRGNEKS